MIWWDRARLSLGGAFLGAVIMGALGFDHVAILIGAGMGFATTMYAQWRKSK